VPTSRERNLVFFGVRELILLTNSLAALSLDNLPWQTSAVSRSGEIFSIKYVALALFNRIVTHILPTHM
jgi:hypothetical protein